MVTEDEVAEIVLGLPGTEQGTSYRQPDFKLNKKFFTCVRQARESDAGALVLHVDFFERDALMAMDPETFFTTDHYRNYPSALCASSALSGICSKSCSSGPGDLGRRRSLATHWTPPQLADERSTPPTVCYDELDNSGRAVRCRTFSFAIFGPKLWRRSRIEQGAEIARCRHR